MGSDSKGRWDEYIRTRRLRKRGSHRAIFVEHGNSHGLIEVEKRLHRVLNDTNDSGVNVSSALIRSYRTNNPDIASEGKCGIEICQK
jgi:hypothetical protein